MSRRHPQLPRVAYQPFLGDDVEPAPVEVALEWIDGFLDRHAGGFVAPLPKLDPGVCDECGGQHRLRYRYAGRLELCHRHAWTRRRVGLQLPACRRYQEGEQ